MPPSGFYVSIRGNAPFQVLRPNNLEITFDFSFSNLNFSENLDDITCKLYLEPDNSPLPLSHLAQPPPSLTWIILEPSNWSLSSYPAPALCQLSSSQPVASRDSGKSQIMPRLISEPPYGFPPPE